MSRPTTRISSLTNSARVSASPTSWMASGSLMMSNTVMRGFNELKGSWKMNWIRLRNSTSSWPPSARMSRTAPWSLNAISPVSGVSARMIIFETVVLPQPLSPTRPRHSPCSTVKLTSSTARTRSVSLAANSPDFLIVKPLVRPSTRSRGPAASASGVQAFLLASSGPPASWVISRIGCSRSPGSMSKRGTARSSAFR